MYPCAPCNSIPSYPDFLALIAALTKSSIREFTSLLSNALDLVLLSADGQTGLSPMISSGDLMPA